MIIIKAPQNVQPSYDMLVCISGKWHYSGQPTINPDVFPRRIRGEIKKWGERLTSAKILCTYIGLESGKVSICTVPLWEKGLPLPEIKPIDLSLYEDALRQNEEVMSEVGPVEKGGEDKEVRQKRATDRLVETKAEWEAWKAKHPKSEWINPSIFEPTLAE